METKKTVLILGGGGVVAATRLRQRLSCEHREVLVEWAPEFIFQSVLLRLITGQRTRAAISRSLAKLSTMKPPGRLMHWVKAVYEKYWLYKSNGSIDLCVYPIQSGVTP